MRRRAIPIAVAAAVALSTRLRCKAGHTTLLWWPPRPAVPLLVRAVSALLSGPPSHRSHPCSSRGRGRALLVRDDRALLIKVVLPAALAGTLPMQAMQ